MDEILNALIAFHEAFEIPWKTVPNGILPKEEFELRHELMREENDEYLEACQEKDLVAIADALGDQLYVLCGTIIAHGLQEKIVSVVEEIHRSNMSKLDANGHPIRRADGKVIKSDRYFPPDLSFVLDNQHSS